MAAQFTCLACKVFFRDPELQRDHYKTDWHRYNLKRKVASLPAITCEEFDRRLEEHRQSEQSEAQDQSQSCKYCSKVFSSRSTYDNHLNSKKHKVAVENYVEKAESIFSDTDSFVKLEPKEVKEVQSRLIKDPKTGKFVVNSTEKEEEQLVASDSDTEEIDSDEWDELPDDYEQSLIKPLDCLFCGQHSRNIVKNLKHMTVAHSFFIPDAEYCVDIRGLLLYLGSKISRGWMCLWCNERGRTFFSTDAARRHMVSKGHCKMLHEGIALAEYSDYYDYSSSYPDHEEGDEDMVVSDEDADADTLNNPEEEDYQMVLPSGVVIGHRSLMKYYKQNLRTPAPALMKKSDRRLHKVLGQYRALGWKPQDQEAIAKTARDIHCMKRLYAKQMMRLSVKANKFQTHFRPQVNY